MSKYADKTLTCRDCGKSFVFTAGEQEFYESRGFSEPTRCADCRQTRKASREGGTYGGARGYGTAAGFGGGGYGGGKSRSGETRGGSRPMYKVTCADCGKETEVPFEPRTGRPVYCRECYEKRSGRR